jgi:ankyrin repeat protein
MLLLAGAKIDSPTGDGATALFLAVEKGNLDVVKLLVKEGTDVNWVRRDSSSVHTVVVVFIGSFITYTPTCCKWWTLRCPHPR